MRQKQSRERLQLQKAEPSILKEFLNYLIIPIGLLLFTSYAKKNILEPRMVPKEKYESASSQQYVKGNYESIRKQGTFSEPAAQRKDLSTKSKHENTSDSDAFTSNSSIDTRIEKLRVEHKVRETEYIRNIEKLRISSN